MTYALTVGDLVRRLALPVDAVGPLTSRIAAVRIIDDLGALQSVDPGTAVVLTGAIAAEPWSIDVALRSAWERAAACVITTTLDARSEATRHLAERLAIPLLIVEAAPLDAAVRIASLVAADESSAAGVLSGAARAFGDAGTLSPRRAIAVLRRLLPLLRFALVDADGVVIAGEMDPDPPSFEVPVPFPHRAHAARLRAVATRGGMSEQVDELVARLAVPGLTAWAALRRLEHLHSADRAEAVFAELLASPAIEEGLRGRVSALGWRLSGTARLAVVAPAPGADPAAFAQALTEAGTAAASSRAVAPYRDAWVIALNESRTTSRERADTAATATLERLLAGHPLLSAATAGLSGPHHVPDELRVGTERAYAAMLTARATGTHLGTGDLGPAAALAALMSTASTDAARSALAPLLEADRDGTLLHTLVSTLDHSERLTEVAADLGVHRNTVAARLERIRALGIDPMDPRQRLAIHIAARRLVDERVATATAAHIEGQTAP
ncbi:CdaR family transcriptional regulator [Microbacterium lacticum]|uniref:PucR family transcriptional regulator n=1 Tax=Microbacterium lacticum TaxID=33885 RepID=UPI001F59FE05|nr:helix-turn-helix domain-containing protein [Microbacterium lacticum]